MMKSIYQRSCIALTFLGSMNTLFANNFFAQVMHSEKIPYSSETSTYLDYLEWSNMEELYKQATTPAQVTAPLAANKNGTPPQKALDVPLSLFTFPKMPEGLFWFWMSKEDTIKKEKIQRFIEESKELTTPKPAEKLFEMIVQHGVRENHRTTLQKARELLNTSKNSITPFIENLVKQLDRAEFDGLIEKIKTPSKSLEIHEKVIFWGNIDKLSDPSKQLNLLEQAPKSLLADKECTAFFHTLTAKPLLESNVDQILKNIDFLRVLSDEMLKKTLQQKEKYARENFWLQQISQLATETQDSFDATALNKKEAALLDHLHSNHERIFFIKTKLNKLIDGKFSNIISNNDEEKLAIHASNNKVNALEKK